MRLLAVDKVNALYDRHAHLSGADFARNVLEDLEVDYEVFVDTHEVLTQLDELGEDTPFITISNHPYGHIDGLILADYFGHRSNYKMMVNQFLNRIEALAPSLIPVTPTGVERTVATTESIMGVRRALAHLRSGGALGLLPAGAISDLSLRDGCVREGGRAGHSRRYYRYTSSIGTHRSSICWDSSTGACACCACLVRCSTKHTAPCASSLERPSAWRSSSNISLHILPRSMAFGYARGCMGFDSDR